MKKWNRKWNRALSLIMTAALTLGSVELPVMAAEDVTTLAVEETQSVSVQENAEQTETFVEETEVESEAAESTDTENAATESAETENSATENTAVESTEEESVLETSGDVIAIDATGTFTLRYNSQYMVKKIEDQTLSLNDIVFFPDATYYQDRPGYFVEWIWLWVGGYGYGRVPSSKIVGTEFPKLVNGSTAEIKPGYTPIKYSISYVLEALDENGEPIVDAFSPAVNEKEAITTYDIEKDVTLPIPTKTGYTFAGWYADTTYSEKINSWTKGVYGDKTLYAKWDENSYTITFDGNGGTPEMQSHTVKYTENVVLPVTTASTADYRIRTWTLSGTDTTYGVGEIVNRLSPVKDGKVTLIANYYNDFSYIKYVLEPLDEKGDPIMDILNPAKNDKANIFSYTHGEKFTFKNPVKTGYTFAGWYADKDYTQKITEIKASDTDDFVLYAKWSENQYTLKLHANDSAKTVHTETLKYTDVYHLPEADYFTNSGHKFVYWGTENSFVKGEHYAPGKRLTKLTDVNGATVDFYALWLDKTSTAMSTTNNRPYATPDNDYPVRWANPVNAYLFANGDNTFTRVERSGTKIVAEQYTAAGEFVEGVKIPFELTDWGGFYAGSKYNYFVFGQDNHGESDTLEAVRVVRYTKDWARVDSCAIKAVNVYEPFEAGSLRMVEVNGRLYIHTCRTMYASGDGKHHQSNMTFVIDANAKELTFLNPDNYTPAYCSHSFNQFIAADGDDVICVDHGDAYPRDIRVRKYVKGNIKNTAFVNIYPIPGEIGANATGVSIGGIEASENGYLVAANSVDLSKGAQYSTVGVRNVFVAYIDKNDFSQEGTTINWLTADTTAANITDPSIVKITDNKFMVLWGVSDKVKYVYIDGKGKALGDVCTLASTHLSDMAPIVVGEQVVWYETNNSKPVFHSIGTYFVNFDSCGGSEVTDQYEISAGAKYKSAIVEMPKPVKTGYSFLGWFTAKEGGKEVTLDSTFNGIADTTLFAHWEPAKYTVSFDTGCDIEVKDMVVKYGEGYGTLPEVDRYGYELIGWYTAKEGGVQIEADTVYLVEADTTLYARYREVKYIVFSANGGLIMSTADMAIGEEVRCSYGLDEIPTPKYDTARANFAFLGWYTDPVGGTLYTFDRTLTDHITLYAHYEPSRQVSEISASIEQGVKMNPGQEISLSTKTVGATIYYYADYDLTTQLSDQEIIQKGQIYENPIVIDKTMFLYVVAVKEDYKNSVIAKFSYDVVPVAEYWGQLTDEDRQRFESAVQVPSELWMSRVSDTNYTGKAQTPAIRVYYGKKLLSEGTDYTVKYKNNVKAGVASIVVTGRGNYKGTITKQFNILPTSILFAEASTLLTIENGKVQKLKPQVTLDFDDYVLKLKQGSDYDLLYNSEGDYTGKGMYAVTIKGKGNYTGEKEIAMTIVEKKSENTKMLSKVKAMKLPAKAYNGSEVSITEDELVLMDGKKQLISGDDFYVVGYKNNTQVGTATIVLIGLGDYVGTMEVPFQITGTPMKNVTITNLETSYLFSGFAIEPKAILTAGEKQLVEGTDYTVTYQKNVMAGTATMIFTGCNGYTGTVKKTFKIVPFDMAVDNGVTGRIVVDLEKSYTYQKNGVTPMPNVTYYSEGNVYHLVAGKDFTVSYKNNKTVTVGRELDTSMMPTVIIKGKGNFKGTYAEKPLVYDIAKADLSILESGLSVSDVVYQEKYGICKPVITLVDVNGKKLVAGTDYDKDIIYTYNSDVTVQKVINKQLVSQIKRAGAVVEKTDIIPADTEICATIKPVDNAKCGYEGSVTKHFRFVQASIAKAKVTTPKVNYSLGGVKFSKDQLTVQIGKTVLQPQDYEIVSYAANDKAGKASITIRGVGNYGGVKTQTFTIAPKIFDLLDLFASK